MDPRIKTYLFYLFEVDLAFVKRLNFYSEVKMIWQKIIGLGVANRVGMHCIFL